MNLPYCEDAYISCIFEATAFYERAVVKRSLPISSQLFLAVQLRKIHYVYYSSSRESARIKAPIFRLYIACFYPFEYLPTQLLLNAPQHRVLFFDFIGYSHSKAV